MPGGFQGDNQTSYLVKLLYQLFDRRPSSPWGRSGEVLLLGVHCLTSGDSYQIIDILY